MRLAFLSPLPPAATGIADYSAEVLGLLAARHEISAFHDQDEVDRERLPPSCQIHSAGSFLERHLQKPYDLAIYQLGNGLHHAFVYEPLARIPGLLVLHDLVLHHSRARMFLESSEALAYARDPSSAALREGARRQLDLYRAEIAYSYPAQAGRLDEAHLGTVGDLLPYAYPLFRLPVESSRLTAVHNDFMAEAVRADVPEAGTVRIPMAADRVEVEAGAVAALRARYGIARDAFVVGAFGLLTREKRIETIARAVARASALLPAVRLLLVGPVPDRHGLERLLGELGVLPQAVITGRVPFPELAAHMEAADMVVHLRYPTARETSAALLRVLAQGRPTVISDLEHLQDIPEEAVARADVTDEEGEVTRAVLRLAESPAARERLGRTAAAFIRREHSPARCLASYEAAISRAREAHDPPRRQRLAHWPQR